MAKYATVALCALALFACQQSETTSTTSGGAKPGTNQPSDMGRVKVNDLIDKAPQFVDHTMLGSELGKDGTVAKDGDSFESGTPIYLTMVFLQSPAGLQAGAVWSTADKKTTIHTERKSMNGGKVATFSVTGLKPGRYKVEGYWGGNIAADRDFEVKAAEKGKRKKG